MDMNMVIDPKTQMKTVIAGALGECVHVAGVANFLRLAEQAGWRTVFLGPAVPVDEFIEAARREKADLIGVSYRLTPETGERLLGEFAEAADDLHSKGVRFAFGGTPPVADRARALGFFESCFDGTEAIDQVIAYLKGYQTGDLDKIEFPQTTIERIQWKSPYPLIRHHFGLPDFETTRTGVQEIAQSGVIDVISLGIDQDAQASFFHPDRQDPRRRGAGGVPVRTPEDYSALYQATRHGNFPLIRTYSGTDDFIRLAEMYIETLHIAWPAIPIFWFNKMDGRGPWDLEGSIREHQNLMAWYGKRGLPVEVNEPHHWGMRDAPDVIYVVAAYLSAYNARAFGVENYIAQMMFNSPPGLSDAMDLAKMLAILKLIEPLTGPDFRIWRQTRTGLLSYPVDEDSARAHLATSVYLQMALHPHIVHVVGYTEADHAATATDVIESCKLARRSIENALGGPDMTQDEVVQLRVEELTQEATITLEAIRGLASNGVSDPLADAATLTGAVQTGILDAPQLKNNPYGRGQIAARIDSRGACIAIHPTTGNHFREHNRIAALIDPSSHTAFTKEF
jgi:methylmalonyl-CoA mutase cobalamin-binding subunit